MKTAVLFLLAASAVCAYPVPDQCRPEKARCMGAAGKKAIPWLPCCNPDKYVCRHDKSLGWGKFCLKKRFPNEVGEPYGVILTYKDDGSVEVDDSRLKGSNGKTDTSADPSYDIKEYLTRTCTKDGDRCMGAKNHPFVKYSACCDRAKVCVSVKGKGWGKFCVDPLYKGQVDEPYVDEPEKTTYDAAYPTTMAPKKTTMTQDAGSADYAPETPAPYSKPMPKYYVPKSTVTATTTEEAGPVGGVSGSTVPYTTEAPKYDTPKYDTPKYTTPKYDTPKYNAPKYYGPTATTTTTTTTTSDKYGSVGGISGTPTTYSPKAPKYYASAAPSSTTKTPAGSYDEGCAGRFCVNKYAGSYGYSLPCCEGYTCVDRKCKKTPDSKPPKGFACPGNGKPIAAGFFEEIRQPGPTEDAYLIQAQVVGDCTPDISTFLLEDARRVVNEICSLINAVIPAADCYLVAVGPDGSAPTLAEMSGFEIEETLGPDGTVRQVSFAVFVYIAIILEDTIREVFEDLPFVLQLLFSFIFQLLALAPLGAPTPMQ